MLVLFLRFFCFILLLTQWPTFAIAQPPHEPVTEQNLLLLGRGITDRDSVLLLACRQSLTCDELQFIYLENHSPSKLAWIGPRFLVEGTLKDSVREIEKKFRKYRKSKNKEIREKIIGFTAFGGSTAYFVHVIALSAAGVTLTLSSVLLPFYGVVAVSTLGVVLSRQCFRTHSTQSQAVLDQTGWNWTETPQRVSKKRMRLFLEFLR